MRFTDNSELTAANATTSDILAGTDVSAGTDVKMTLGGLGEYFVEDYAGSTLAGSAQNVKSAVDTLNSNLAQQQTQINALSQGTPTVVDDVADMTDTSLIYILSSDGYWYYYDSDTSSWVAGGEYGGAVTDTSLTVSGNAADALVTGNAIRPLTSFKDNTEGNVWPALLTCLQHVTWDDADGQTYYTALYNAMNPSYTITNTLTNCTTNNNSASVAQYASYAATITVNSVYLSPTVSVTMGGDDVTAAVYSNGTISIPSVTGDVVITATAASGYTLYDYIGQTGSMPGAGIIFTDAAMSSDYTLSTEIYYSSASLSSVHPLMGTRSVSYVKNFGIFITPSTGKMNYWWDGADSTNTIYPFTINAVKSVKFLPVGKSATYPSNMTIVVDGTEYDSGASGTGTTFDSWFGFFGYVRDTTGTQISANIGAKIGETVIYDANDDIIYDFVPASNGTYCGLYETVSGTFYANETYNSYYECGSWSEV